jgi:hypothetical protein
LSSYLHSIGYWKKLIVAAVAATMASVSMADISIKGDAYLQYADNGIDQSGSKTKNTKRVKNLSEIAKMVLIIQVFTAKSTLLCKKNTKDSFFTTKSKNNDY